MDDPEEKKLEFIDTPIHCIDIKTGVAGLIKQIYKSVILDSQIIFQIWSLYNILWVL